VWSAIYVTARCHNSYRKNDSPHSVECDIVMIDTSSSQQGGWEALHPPGQNVGGMHSRIPPPLTPVHVITFTFLTFFYVFFKTKKTWLLRILLCCIDYVFSNYEFHTRRSRKLLKSVRAKLPLIPSFYPPQVNSSPPHFTHPILSIPILLYRFPLTFFLSSCLKSYSQLEVGESSKLPAGFGAEPQLQMHLVHFMVVKCTRWHKISLVAVQCRPKCMFNLEQQKVIVYRVA